MVAFPKAGAGAWADGGEGAGESEGATEGAGGGGAGAGASDGAAAMGDAKPIMVFLPRASGAGLGAAVWMIVVAAAAAAAASRGQRRGRYGYGCPADAANPRLGDDGGPALLTRRRHRFDLVSLGVGASRESHHNLSPR